MCIRDSIGNFPSRVFFSIPMQQTARYLKEYPDDVTKEEAKAIDGVMKYDEIADLYNPELSDPVKATYRGGHITMAKLKRCHGANVICNGSPSRILSVLLISFGITTRPRSSIRRTIPVAFIAIPPPIFGISAAIVVVFTEIVQFM